MTKYCNTILCLILALLVTTSMAQVDYSNHVTYYHYPAPPKTLQFRAPPPQTQRIVNAAPQTYQNQYQASSQYASHNNYQTTSAVQQSSTVAKQFISPALDNAAFNLALTNQGYTIGNTPAVNAALTATSRSSKTSAPQSNAAPASVSSYSSSPQLASLNVKLPLPIGITPLNIAPLPLQSGAPYAAIQNTVTSYGTVYPQRKRR